LSEGSCFPTLSQSARKGGAPGNQRAKYYRITAAGKEQLAENRSRWEQMVAAIGGVLGTVVE